jgi:hypothetical protein
LQQKQPGREAVKLAVSLLFIASKLPTPKFHECVAVSHSMGNSLVSETQPRLHLQKAVRPVGVGQHAPDAAAGCRLRVIAQVVSHS